MQIKSPSVIKRIPLFAGFHNPMGSAVQTFNSLPREQSAPSGIVSNHWHFSIRHVPLEPPGDLVFVLNPEARYIHVEGPRTILALPTATAQAEVIAPLLLKAFNEGLGTPPATPKLAPWTWSTTTQELATAVGAKLKDMGVRQDLIQIGHGNAMEEQIAVEEWERFMGQLKFLHLRPQ
jgi:hypothetical protein